MEVQFRTTESGKKHEVLKEESDYYILKHQPHHWSSDCRIAVLKSAVDIVPEYFSFGTKFYVGAHGLCLLAQVGFSSVALISLSTGNRLEEAIKVKDVSKISREELNRLSHIKAELYTQGGK